MPTVGIFTQDGEEVSFDERTRIQSGAGPQGVSEGEWAKSLGYKVEYYLEVDGKIQTFESQDELD